jgi:protein TonB
MIRVAPSLNTAVPCAQPVYPAASRREEEEGTVGLLIVVDADGRVTDARVDKSSGFARLDDAARIAFSKCQFKPGTLDGKPEPSTVRRNYRWKLEE